VDRLRAWLHGVLRHKVVDQLRHQLGEPAPETPAAEPAAEGNDPARHAAGRQGLRALEQALAGLPPKQARAFWMREALGWTTDEVCTALDVSAGHAFVLLHRARRELQRQLQPHRP
jgi:RNA polymerase sigma factor (sigma-70 family)